MRFRLPSSFRNSKTVRLHSFAFAALAVAGLAITTFFQVSSVDVFVRDVYFVVALGHIVFAAATLFGVYAVGWTIFQALGRRSLNERLGQLHFWLTLVGILLCIGTVTAFSMASSAESAHDPAILAACAMLFTFSVQVVYPAAMVLSWFRPKTA